jgi:dolichyl-phosphate beta-glucosyltransferase
MDDASTDGCVELMKQTFIRDNFHVHQFSKNKGKGFSIKVGVEKSLGEYIMFMDADLAVPVEYIPRMVDELRAGNDVVIGIRLFDIENSSRIRRIIGFSLLLYINIVLPLPPVPDTQCGFKGFSRDAANKLFSRMRIAHGMFDVELLMIAQKARCRIRSLPVHWQEKSGSTIRLWKCLVLDPFDIIKIKINDLLGRY